MLTSYSSWVFGVVSVLVRTNLYHYGTCLLSQINLNIICETYGFKIAIYDKQQRLGDIFKDVMKL